LSISQIVSSFNYKSCKKLSGRIRTAKRSGKRIFPGRLGDRPLSEVEGAAIGAAPLWKFAKQIWFEAEGRNPTVGLNFRLGNNMLFFGAEHNKLGALNVHLGYK
jgi:hypothetical protein